MIKFTGIVREPYTYANGITHRWVRGYVSVYHRTKRSIIKPNATLQAERKAQWNGTITLR